MDEKIFNSPEELVAFFNENQGVLTAIPWGRDLISHWNSINKGCSCKRKARVENANAVYKELIINVLAKNVVLGTFLKENLKVEKVTFKLNEEVVAVI
tara:strand:+ start:81 stop:374 length:294 start_codon:yes stop_codon:yes gene_type:complete